MVRRQAYKFQLKPTATQNASMKSFAGACRFVYNRALTMQSTIWRNGDRFIPYNKMASWLVDWKGQEETTWLTFAPSQILQQSLKDLDKAFNNLFSHRAAFPSPKKKGRNDAFRYPPQRVKLDEKNERVLLPKLGWVRYRKSRNINGILKNITISMKLGKWYISFQTETEMDAPQKIHNYSIIALDISNPDRIISSDGINFLSQASFSAVEKSLDKKINQLRRKKQFSSNWTKQKSKVDKILHRISNMRKDHFHKVSTSISKNHAIVVIENFDLTTSLHKRNKVGRSGAGKFVYEFKRQLDYKLKWNGGELIIVCERDNNPKILNANDMVETSEHGELRVKEILAAGHAVIACRGMEQFSHPLKQEPSESGRKKTTLL